MTHSKLIKILILEDNNAAVRGLESIIRDIQIKVPSVATPKVANNLQHYLETLVDEIPSVAIIDLEVPGIPGGEKTIKAGLEAVQTTRRKYPATRVIVQSGRLEEAAPILWRYDVPIILDTSASSDQISQFILEDVRFVTPIFVQSLYKLIGKFWPNLDDPPQSKEILRMIGQDMSRRQICDELGISENQYKHIGNRILARFNVTSLKRAYQRATHLGLLD